MDTSETYIKMMGKAWPYLKDDAHSGNLMLFSRRLRMLYVLDGKVVLWRDKINTGNMDRAFPLLEQDQLQEMLGFDLEDLVKLFYEFAMCMWASYEDDEIYRRFDYGLCHHYANIEITSMEQLWLAFYMTEKRNKYWNGEDWVKKIDTPQN